MNGHVSPSVAASVRANRLSGYEGTRPDVQNLVPRSARRILDLGCSTGRLGAELKARQGARITGVELIAEYAAEAEGRLDRVHTMSVETFLVGPSEETYDCIVAADVLEHLADPWVALRDVVGRLDPGGTAVVSVPNVLFWKNFYRLVRERSWPREDEGIFDRTHLRWFSLSDAEDLVRSAGLEIEIVEPRYWADNWRLATYKRLAKTKFRPYLAAQTLVRGVLR